jgi:hypothetical protein
MFAAGKTAAVSAAEPDDKFNYVTMLLHGDGTNGAQNNTFVDSSSNNFTITRNGNATQGSFSPYGSNWSNYFDGNGDYLSAPTSVITSSGDFTIECWINAKTSSSNTFVLAQFTSGSSGRTGFGLGGNVVQMFLGGFTNNGATTIPYGKWTHLAFTRSGTTFKAYVNGTLDLTVTSSVSIDQVNTNIGGDPAFSPALYFSGYISNMRVTNTVVYTGNFTPSTTPLTAISGTQLLTCQSNRFKDNSSNNYTLTVNGETSVQRFNPFGTSTAYSTSVIGGSAYFDGSGDYLDTPTSSAFAFGTGNFTSELWVYLSRSNGTIIYEPRTSSNEDNPCIAYGVVTANKFEVANSGIIITSSSTFGINQWHHVAIVRSGTTLTLWVNGTNQGSTTLSTNLTNNDRIRIGEYFTAGTYALQGYVSNLRVVKGTAVYTSAFTPSTTPLTAISGTSLLTSMTNGAIFENAMMNDLETVGNAQISTSVKKYGTGSLSFDGTGDYLINASNQNVSWGTGDFTIEGWFYWNSLASESAIVWGNGVGWVLYIYPANKLQWGRVSPKSPANLLTGSTSLSTGQWYHIAVTRSSGTVKLWVNGVSDGTITDADDYSASGKLAIGISHSSEYFNGYIDDLRITKGYARYTSTFTPPTSAFSDKGPY